jgi:TonB family protein
MALGMGTTTNRLRVSQRGIGLLALVLSVLMPAVTATANVQEWTEGRQAPPDATPTTRGTGTTSLHPFSLRSRNNSQNGSGLNQSSVDRADGKPTGSKFACKCFRSSNPKLRSIFAGTDRDDVHLAVAVWVDPDGHINRVRFDKSSGDSAFDAIVASEIQAHFRLSVPPNDMPQPIKVTLTYKSPRSWRMKGEVPRFIHLK